ncbi:DUF4387 domain-containing protein [Streptomyces scopuliridis]|uniref:DUF4387 domain-containing protein n=1 Tax=Streptomyces scopuliridis TaxID=452529 RepID=A0ACD4ZY56_9ACTN|nr:DUF4387 family protein [Streptomyces scopuliridis]WSB37357.1 DUF4387 domain-containing protein [Streptomyces scopuliridis]WSC01972.1 DUF4387 domain-containing protein [Streptomyces scopuliridis]WSC04491.1 DUF4387 domain-containing protein [Streptomyces scopuliridis]
MHEPAALDPAELGVLITVTAPDQRTAHPVSTFVAHASAHVKVSLPRPTVQGSPRDSDRYAGQQYAPLMAMELPEPDRPV